MDSEKTANEQGAENLAKLSIQTRIYELKAQRNDLIGINAIYFLNRFEEISCHFCNLLDTEREKVSAELSETANHSVEAQEAARCLAIAS